MVNTEEQVLFAQVISHLPVELRQHLAARQLTGRLSQARKIGPRGRALDTPMPPPDFRCVETRHFANSPCPGERARCSTWAKCLG
jgi:hypothetical protein